LPALVAVWWLTIRPSNTGDWQPEVAEAPYVEIDGDRIVIHNFRNFDYFSKTDFRPRWETKTVQLSNLRTVDFFTNFWGPKLICHTFVSFDFGPDGYVCISIETRMAKGQTYSAIAGLYRQSRSITSLATSAISCGFALITGLKTSISIT
jgi:uncharacterized protein DUF4105